MKVAIAQPTYLPWLGYFDLIDQVDTFVLLDDVQFEKQSWQQRNRIKTPAGLQWLTIPVVFRGRLEQKIKDVEIRVPDFWRDHIRAIELNYRRAPFFDHYYEPVKQILSCAGLGLSQLNERLIEFFMNSLELRTALVRSSALNQEGQRTERLANLCESLGASEYFSPIGSAAYLLAEKEKLQSRGVQILFQNYTHPEYEQLFPPFVPYASALDLLFNVGPQSMELIRRGRGKPLTVEEVSNLVDRTS
jgi:hypothetical protein